MCGIIVITGSRTSEVSDANMSMMLDSICSRGPDEKDFLRLGNTVLGQTRLAIVDIIDGHQPMRDNKHPYTIVFNGEIYGYKELRDKLEKLGHSFGTKSDTEVILKAYAEYGERCVEHLDGMFAFAIWDENKQQLFIARDRFGKKPFYYSSGGGVFFGASEIKALFEGKLTKGRIDDQSLDDYLRLGYIPPWKTIYSNVHTLPPAHAGIVKDQKLKTWRYWRLEKRRPGSQISYDEAKTEIKRLLVDAVRKRMVADVEIGSLLSGGVDSTLITAYAQKCSPRPIKTFALGYGASKNELPFALEASRKIGTEHHTCVVDVNNLEELRKVIGYFDEPHADSSDFPQQLISKHAASKVKVALSGDGADELFMGYGWYQKYWHTPIYKRIFETPFSAYKKMTEIFREKERDELYLKKIQVDRKIESAMVEMSSDPFDKINKCDLGIYLPGQLLVKVDRASMMHSLEVRCPFLDTALAEFVYNLPNEFKMDKNNSKIILKDILCEIMPKEFVRRRKQGFGAPLQNWFREEGVKKELSRITKDGHHPVYSYLKKEAVCAIFLDTDSQNKTSIQKAWVLLCLCIWFELHQKYHE
ncbi:MAG: hypothetical protein RL536_344 [Candidatus Parcubacteria bacterium]|jgi:asparagine synthase (glutamine-hydrolysing)